MRVATTVPLENSLLLRMLQVASFAGRMNMLFEIRRVLQMSDPSFRGSGDS